eukprot:sb/3464155/
MAEFGISRQCLKMIKERESRLDAYEVQFSCKSDQRKSLKRPLGQTVDEALYAWVRTQRSANVPLNSLILKAKAKWFNTQLGGPESFQASNGWLYKYCQRHGITFKKSAGEAIDADSDEAERYRSVTLPALLQEEGIVLDQLFNADETGLIYRKAPNSSYVLAEEKGKLPGRKQAKERVTLMEGGNAAGTIKLPMVMVGKSKKPRCFNKMAEKAIPVRYRAQKKAWMSSEVFSDIFLKIWVPHIKCELQKKGLDQRAIILVDNATCHQELEKDGIKVRFLPANTTSLIQPMDQGVIAALKRRYISSFTQCLADKSDDVEVHAFIRQWDLKDTAFSVAKAWDTLTESTMRNSWNPLLNIHGDSTSVDLGAETDHEADTDPIVQEWAEEEVPCTEELTEELTEGEIVDSIICPNDEEHNSDDDSEEVQAVVPPAPPSQMIQTLEFLMGEIVQHPDAKSFDTLWMKGWLDKYRRAECLGKKQTSLTQFGQLGLTLT